MRLTVNQVEHILERWHRLRRGTQVHFGSSDPTRLTVEARREAQQYVVANSTVDTGITPRNILEFPKMFLQCPRNRNLLKKSRKNPEMFRKCSG